MPSSRASQASEHQFLLPRRARPRSATTTTLSSSSTRRGRASNTNTPIQKLSQPRSTSSSPFETSPDEIDPIAPLKPLSRCNTAPTTGTFRKSTSSNVSSNQVDFGTFQTSAPAPGTSTLSDYRSRYFTLPTASTAAAAARQDRKDSIIKLSIRSIQRSFSSSFVSFPAPPVPSIWPSIWQMLSLFATELLGTLIWLSLGLLSETDEISRLHTRKNGSRILENASIWTIIWFINVWILSHLQTGFLNPAIVLTLALTRWLPAFRAAVFLVAQLLGSVLAAGIITGLRPWPLLDEDNQFTQHYYKKAAIIKSKPSDILFDATGTNVIIPILSTSLLTFQHCSIPVIAILFIPRRRQTCFRSWIRQCVASRPSIKTLSIMSVSLFTGLLFSSILTDHLENRQISEAKRYCTASALSMNPAVMLAIDLASHFQDSRRTDNSSQLHPSQSHTMSLNRWPSYLGTFLGILCSTLTGWMIIYLRGHGSDDSNFLSVEDRREANHSSSNRGLIERGFSGSGSGTILGSPGGTEITACEERWRP